MNNMLKYTKMLLLFVLVLGLTSCDSEEETEYNLPGEWYTSEEIDFGAYSYSFSGTWYNSWREYQDNIHGQPFRMRRQ